MAFDSSKLKCVYHANGFGLFLYNTAADAKATVDTTGYFANAIDKLGVGSFILATCSDGAGIFYVNANDGSTIDVADAVAIGGTDTD